MNSYKHFCKLTNCENVVDCTFTDCMIWNCLCLLQIAATSALANWALILLRHTEFGGVTELGPREDALKAILEVSLLIIMETLL